MFLGETYQEELEKRLSNPKFEELFFELLTLKSRCYPDLIVTCYPEFTPQEIDTNKPIRVEFASGRIPSVETLLFRPISQGKWEITRVNHISSMELAGMMAEQLWREAQRLGLQLAAFFPPKHLGRWAFIFSVLALNDEAGIRQNRGRPEGSGTYRSREEFEAALKNAITSLESVGEYPSQARVAELLNFENRKEIYRYCATFDIAWKDVIRR